MKRASKFSSILGVTASLAVLSAPSAFADEAEDSSAEFDANLVQAPEPEAKPKDGQKAESEKVEKPENESKVEPPQKETILNKPDEVKKEIEVFNQRVKDWAYLLPSFRVENFSKLKKDLIEKK